MKIDLETIDRIVNFIAESDVFEALNVSKKWIKQHGYENLASNLLLPVIGRFTEKYFSTNDVSLSRGYVASRYADEIMQMVLKATAKSPIKETKGPVIIGNIEDDFHALGRKIVTTFLKTSGWKVYDLGNDITAREFVDAAVENGAKIIGVSAMMYATAINIKKVREELDKRGLSGKIQLAVGGAVFIMRPELVEMVGGDGTAQTAATASPLFDELWTKAENYKTQAKQ
jgi:methylmalonyl-CoA mutase cobalamin-binding domain/chain